MATKKMDPVRQEHPAGFTYLSNHAHVLVCLNQDPEMRLRDIAVSVGITERAVQRIIAELEAAGSLRHEREGRRNRYEIQKRSRLRHPLESHCTVGGLLDWITGLKS
ncbi:MAG: winged helix-turn-helix domain-containing protein [Candidatus Methylacidiphilales bacterium]|nr:winged helix-turn-helix domain-containing protein [Candidatus Methylacidiphilales bacterium]